MHLDWATIIGAIIATWPPVIAGFIVNWNKTRSHVDQVTQAQSEQIAELTRVQTQTLLRGTGPAPDD